MNTRPMLILPVLHRNKIEKLVYFEQTTDVRAALEREKQLKGWRRSKKNALIDKMNPQWRDLYTDLLG